MHVCKIWDNDLTKQALICGKGQNTSSGKNTCMRGRLDQNRGVDSLAFLRGWHCVCCPRPRQLETTYSRPIMRMMTINGYLLNLKIDLVLKMFADTGQEVIECVVQQAWGFPPRSKWMLRKVFHPAVVPPPLFRQNLLMLKLMWQFVLNRVWQIVRCMFTSGSNNREAAALKDVLQQERDDKSLGWFVNLHW